MVKIDNSAVEQARSIVTSIVPVIRSRKAILQQLIDSSEAATRIAPSAWGVTLFKSKDGFRLNVGQVEVFAVRGDVMLLNCVGHFGVMPFKGELFNEANYRSVPDPSCAYNGPVDRFASKRLSLQEPHFQFIHRAATTQSGEPRKGSPFRKSHSEALIAYARSEIGRT